MASKNRYKATPVLVARYAWVNKPDVKYNQEGLYHVDGIGEGEEVEAYKAEIEAFAQEAFDAFIQEKGFKPAEAKKWGIHLPFEEEVDSEGAATGRTIFKFKQNAVIHLTDGSTKRVVMGIRDAKNKETKANIFGGATIRVMAAPRGVPMSNQKKVGVRLDFCMVQLIKPAPSRGGGFDEVEGGYVDEGFDDDAPNAEANTDTDY